MFMASKTLLQIATPVMALTLAACGSDDSSSSGPRNYSGLSVKPLTYSGAETDATISSTNFQDIAEAVHVVALSEMNSELITEMVPRTDLGEIVPPNIGDRRIAVVGLQASLQKSIQLEPLAQRDIAAIDWPDVAENDVEYTAVGECGGEADIHRVQTWEGTEEAESGTDNTFRSDTRNEEISVRLDDYCYYMRVDGQDVAVTTSGRMSSEASFFEESSDLNNTQSSSLISHEEGDLVMTMADNQFAFASETDYNETYDRTEDPSTFEYTYDPDTYVNQRSTSFAMSSPGGTGYYTLVTSREVDPADNTELTERVTEELLEAGGQVLKYSGYVDDGFSAELEVYVPQYGLVSAENDTSLVMCNDGSGVESGSLNIDAGADMATAEITIAYTSCSEASVTFVADSTTETLEQ
ncbi:MAG: hypothetical protein CMI02_12040 [Oceanospirillaceae bacterium]|nr:hypothetical protein [Oceanospirillaceae bacterium]